MDIETAETCAISSPRIFTGFGKSLSLTSLITIQGTNCPEF